MYMYICVWTHVLCVCVGVVGVWVCVCGVCVWWYKDLSIHIIIATACTDGLKLEEKQAAGLSVISSGVVKIIARNILSGVLASVSMNMMCSCHVYIHMLLDNVRNAISGKDCHIAFVTVTFRSIWMQGGVTVKMRIHRQKENKSDHELQASVNRSISIGYNAKCLLRNMIYLALHSLLSQHSGHRWSDVFLEQGHLHLPCRRWPVGTYQAWPCLRTKRFEMYAKMITYL